jgi:predicted CxxxxCH...CXXCH cytochrome family protein
MRCPRAAPLGLAVIAAAAIGGKAATQTPSQASSVQALVANGQKVFEGTCSNQYCHGTGGAGAQGPRLVDHPVSPEIVRSAIHDGRSGTPMLPFKDILEPPQLEAVIAYVLSISSGGRLPVSAEAPNVPAEPPGPSTVAIAIGAEKGTPASGADIFFDSTRLSSCHTCHSYNKRGGPLGLDFAEARLSAEEILASVSKPHLASRTYPVITVTTQSGVKLTGIRRDETDDTLRIFDVAVPPVLRSFRKSEVADILVGKTGIFDHTRLGYTRQQMLDVAALLGTAK